MNIRSGLMFGLLLSLAVLLVGCGGSGNGDGAFTGDIGNGVSNGEEVNAEPGDAVDIQATADKVEIVADGTDFATINVLVRDSSNIGVEGVPVTVSIDRPDSYTLLVDRKNTAADGTVSARLSSRESRAGNALVTASIDGTDKVSNPLGFTFVGSSLVVEPASLDLVVADRESVTARVRDGSGSPAGFASVCVDLPSYLSSEALGPVFGCEVGLLGDENGEATFDVTAEGAGTDDLIRISAVGNEVDVPVTVSVPNIAFDSPDPDEVFAKSKDVQVVVSVPQATEETFVRFVTTSGTFSSSGLPEATVQVSDGTASDDLVGFSSGRVTILAENLNSEEKTSVSIVTFDDAELTAEETFLAIQATPASLSVGDDNRSTITLTATRFVDEQLENEEGEDLPGNLEPVPPGTPVRFEFVGSSLGASLSSPLALTDLSGNATVRLTAGEIPSSGEGLAVRACIDTIEKCDRVNVQITDKPGSISIGLGNVLETTNDETAYQLPVSVIATDISGNALENVDVSVSVWPTRYRTGVRDGDGNPDIIDTFLNEDVNRNVTRDPNDLWSTGGGGRNNGVVNVSGSRTTCASAGSGEPTIDETFGSIDASENGCKLLPESTAAGSVPTRISTDTSGLATFNLTYLKDRADFVEAEIRATTVVQGTEVQASRTFWLPRLDDDDNLPDSPYNVYFE